MTEKSDWLHGRERENERRELKENAADDERTTNDDELSKTQCARKGRVQVGFFMLANSICLSK